MLSNSVLDFMKRNLDHCVRHQLPGRTYTETMGMLTFPVSRAVRNAFWDR